VLGDTAYFAPFANEADANAFAALCAGPGVSALLAQRIVPGKRPVTKALLDAIDWADAAATFEPKCERLAALFRETVSP
jgi:hypothetical protein